MNYSAQKEIVLKALKDNVVHPTAEYLCDRIREAYPTLGVATVYRNLNKMAEGGVIKKIDGLEQKAHFDHNTHEHYHMMCDKCKRIFDVSSNVAPNILEKTENEMHCKVTSYDVILHGICEDCLKEE